MQILNNYPKDTILFKNSIVNLIKYFQFIISLV